MQTASKEYVSAITAGHRRIVPQAVIDLVDPDITYGPVVSNGEMFHSDPGQLYNKLLEAEGPKYGTLELNRWLLDGSFTAMPDDPAELEGEHGYLIDQVSDQNCELPGRPFVELQVQNLSILQAASVHFTGLECDGYGVDFLFQIFSGDQVVFYREVTGNTKQAVFFEGFTVRDVTALRVTFSRWSHPYRRPRVAELLPGIYEKWDGGDIYAIDVVQETAFDCLTVPYGSCTMEVRNQAKRFNPFSKSSLFQSIEARQGIPVLYGAQLPDGSIEFVPLGVFYQQNGGWETDAYGLTIRFKLVDIVGLVANRDYVAPDPLPTTLSGWIASIVEHLGQNFKNRYEVAEGLSGMEMTILNLDEIKNMNCGQILRYVSMAAGAFFRADAVTGKLKVEPLPERVGIAIGLKDMYAYPKNQAGDSIAQITFRLADSAKTEYIVEGTLQAADKSLSISNPFIHTEEQADAAAAYIMQFYGTTKFTIRGRGDMRSELGDADTFETGFGGTSEGRRYKQQLKLTNGIVKTAPSYLLAAGRLIEVTGKAV